MIVAILMIAAVVLLVLATLGVAVGSIAVGWAGLACWAAAQTIPMLRR